MIDTIPFPKLRFLEVNTLAQQLAHIRSEVMEVELALQTEGIERVAEEVADVMISAKTMLDIIQRLHGIHPLDVVLRAQQKNRARGYEV